MSFRFKQFTVEDQKSTLRVGTDAVLLGAWVNVSESKKILEIGTGCGLISLMAAQRSDASIVAIDTDLPSILQAAENFSASPWSDRLVAVHDSIQNFSRTTSLTFDHIITNPPFFRNSLKSPDPQVTAAKHDDGRFLEELLACLERIMTRDGMLSLILPDDEARKFVRKAQEHGIPVSRKLGIRPKVDKPVNRQLLEFSHQRSSDNPPDELIIRRADNSYTDEYKAFTDSYYLSLP
jgi:tRNA1Val (adenine37-N6)-methyltransferase